MRLPHQTDLAGVDVAMLGVPYDGGTSYRSGARLGPREIRAQSSLITALLAANIMFELLCVIAKRPASRPDH